MTDQDLKLPRMNTIEELSENRRKQAAAVRARELAIQERRQHQREKMQRQRQRRRLAVTAVACLAVAILAVALNQGKPAATPQVGQTDAANSAGTVPGGNGNSQQGFVVPVKENPAEKDSPAIKKPLTEQEKAVAYVKAVAKGEATFAHTGRSGRISENSTAKKMVALTFDDGPYGSKTEEYLKILQEYDVPATFFCLGSSVEKYPEAAKAIVAAGSELGSHSLSHKNLPKVSTAVMTEDFRKTAAIFQKVLGFEPYLFRAPYGASNDSLKTVAKQNGAAMIFWSVDTNDWRKPSADTLVNRAVNSAKDGSIILMHEGKTNTLAALPRIIQYLQGKGYQFVTVSQLLYENSAAQKADQAAAAGAKPAAAAPKDGTSNTPKDKAGNTDAGAATPKDKAGNTDAGAATPKDGEKTAQ